MLETVQVSWEKYALLGNEKFEENQLEEAIANYEKAIELGCDQSWVYIKLGDVYGEVGEFELALEWIEKAIALDDLNLRKRLKLHRRGKFVGIQNLQLNSNPCSRTPVTSKPKDMLKL